jgi:biopolymer transport protein ExbD
VKPLAALLAVAITVPAASSAESKPQDLHILTNGHARFGNGPELNDKALRDEIRRMMKLPHRPDIRIVPERTAPYDDVAHVLQVFQQLGYGAHFGITGVQK